MNSVVEAADYSTPARWALQERWRREGWLDRPDMGRLIMDRIARAPRRLVRLADKRGRDAAGGERRVERTGSQIASEALAVATGLLRAGVRRGDRAIVQLPDPVDRWSATVALAVLGVVAVPVSSSAGTTDVQRIAADCGATTALLGSTWRGRELSGHALAASSDIERFVVAGGGGHDGVLRWEDLCRTASEPLSVFGTASADDVFVILYTSGSTGTPKGVVHTHGGFAAEMLTGHDNAAGGVYGGVQLTPYPGGHLSALTGDLRALLHNHATVVLADWEAELAASSLVAEGVTTTNGTPYFLTSLLDYLRSKGIGGEGLSYRSGAASVPARLVEDAADLGVLAFRCYGSSEHPTVTNGGPYLPLGLRSTSDGVCLPGVRIRLVSEDGTPLAKGQAGLLETAGPDQFVGYTDPAVTAAAFTPDGWYRTMDLATIDDGGFLTVSGRVGDTINRGGSKFSPAAIEEALRSHPRIADVSVVGRPDETYGERVHAFVVSADGAPVTVDAVREHLQRMGMDRHASPEGVTMCDRLPVTQGGKVDRKALRASFDR